MTIPVHRSDQPVTHPGGHLGKGLYQRGTVIASALGHVPPTASLSIDSTSNLGDQFTRLDLASRRTIHSGDESGLAITGPGQQDYGISQLLLEAIYRFTQRLGVETFQARGYYLDSPDQRRGGRQVGGGAAGRLGLEGIQFTLEPLLAVQQSLKLISDIGHISAQQAGRVLEAAL